MGIKENNIFDFIVESEDKLNSKKGGDTFSLQKSVVEKNYTSKNKLKWAELSDNHIVGKFIDDHLGSNWISMSTSEIVDRTALTEYELDILDIIEFSAIPSIKKKKNELSSAMLELNMEATVNQKIADGADMKDIKSAKAMFNQVEDDGRTYIYLQNPTQHQNADELEHTCVSCGNKLYCEEFRRNKKDE